MGWNRFLRMGSAVASAMVIVACVPLPSPPVARNFKFAEMSAEACAQITAYVKPMRMLRECQIQPDYSCVKAKARQTADYWLLHRDAHELKDVMPTCAEDTSRDGARNQIVSARETLAHALVFMARDAAARGDKTQAAEDLARAFRLCEIMKYSDSVSLPSSLSVQLYIVEVGKQLAIDTDPRLIQAYASLPSWDECATRLAQVIKLAASYRFIESESLSTKVSKSTIALANAVETVSPTELAAQELGRAIAIDTNLEPDIRVLARMGLRRAVQLEIAVSQYGALAARQPGKSRDHWLARG